LPWILKVNLDFPDSAAILEAFLLDNSLGVDEAERFPIYFAVFFQEILILCLIPEDNFFADEGLLGVVRIAKKGMIAKEGIFSMSNLFVFLFDVFNFGFCFWVPHLI
jgi:hypothetical protein